jgi:hypothetical protein
MIWLVSTWLVATLVEADLGESVVGHRVFINYRGGDTGANGALLHTDLTRRFGEHHVFLDAASIPAGANYVTTLLQCVRSAQMVLAVIGPHWLSATDDTGRRRIDNPDDWIRRELAEAFAAGIRVIPVLTDDATLPTESELPADIAVLSCCQYRHLRRREHATDLERIADDLTALDPVLAVARIARARSSVIGVVRVGVPAMLADRYQPRPALTDQLDKTVSAVGTVVLTQVLAGGGGVGKTQLAAHYAATRWLDPELRLAVWVSARSRDAIIAAYAQAASDLLDADSTDPDRAAARLLAWCASTPQRWLIVLDDLQHPEDLDHLWPPATADGQVVVTTRRRDPSLARTDRSLINIGAFTAAEAHDYLAAKLTHHPDLVEGMDGLAADLGYLPLALAQAVAYLANRGWTCQRYRDRLADHRQTLCQVLPEPGELPDDHTDTVAATFALSMRLAHNIKPVGMAGPVMLVACLLDPTGVPRSVFSTDAVQSHLSHILGKVVGTDEVDETLSVLHRLSLLTLDRHTPHRAVQVHALVQRATREDPEHTPHTLAAAARTAADAVLEIWPVIERDTDLAAALRSNTQALQAVAEPALWTPDGHETVFRAGHSLGQAGLVTDAITHFQCLLTTALTHLGPDHPDTLNARHNLAIWRGEAGDPAGAATTVAELLTDLLRVLGPDHLHTLAARHNLAYWRGIAGDPVGAATAFAELLTDERRVLGPDHADTLAAQGNLARWRGVAGDPAGATTAFADLLRVLGPDHPHTLTTRHDLAYWCGEAGDPAGAATAFA